VAQKHVLRQRQHVLDVAYQRHPSKSFRFLYVAAKDAYFQKAEEEAETKGLVLSAR
jgi:hypothetical protein